MFLDRIVRSRGLPAHQLLSGYPVILSYVHLGIQDSLNSLLRYVSGIFSSFSVFSRLASSVSLDAAVSLRHGVCHGLSLPTIKRGLLDIFNF